MALNRELSELPFAEIFMHLVVLDKPAGVQQDISRMLIDEATQLDSANQQHLLRNLCAAWGLADIMHGQPGAGNIADDLKAACVYRDRLTASF